MNLILAHYGEIGLKGKNQRDFEKQLVKNIKIMAKRENLTLDVKREHNRMFISSENEKDVLTKFLKKIFGIKDFSFVDVIDSNIDSIMNKANEILNTLNELNVKSISIKTKRSDKKFPVKSPELNSKIGDIARNLGIKVDYKGAKDIIFIEITETKTYVYFEKIKGAEGLPVGSAGGRVLCLLSGGIDSPVAAMYLMKRGCHVDFIHFHSLVNNDIAFKSKITRTVEKLNELQGHSQLIMVPNVIYEMLTGGKMESRYELIFFKYYLLNFACKYALENDYDAIVTGDNLAQVASQTLQNLRVTSHNTTLPIFRPLLCYEKEDIINISKKMGTFELAIEDYKDCCSLLAKNPATKARLDKFEKYLSKIDLDELYKETQNALENRRIN